MNNSIEDFNSFSRRGEVRKIADRLLDMLGVSYLNNLTMDNREDIKRKLEDIKNSGINWEVDVVKSVREKYKNYTSPDVIKKHMERIDGIFKN